MTIIIIKLLNKLYKIIKYLGMIIKLLNKIIKNLGMIKNQNLKHKILKKFHK